MLNWLLQLLKRLTRNEMLRMGLCFILIEAHSILPSPSGGFSTLLMLCSLFLRKVILLTMLAVNVFSSISNKKKQIANVIVRLRSFSYLFLNILKGITTQKDRTERLICLRQMKQKLYIGSRQNSLLPLKKLYFFVSTYLTIVQNSARIQAFPAFFFFLFLVLSCSSAYLYPTLLKCSLRLCKAKRSICAAY